MSAEIVWSAVILSMAIYLLQSAIHDLGATAELRVIVGATLFTAGLFTAHFHLKRYLATRRTDRHARGKT
jgi:uncharacterized membrane protein